MTLVLEEPFNDLSVWMNIVGSPVIVPGGRTGNALQLGGAGQVMYRLPAQYEDDVMTVGCAFKTTSATTARTGSMINYRGDAAASNHASLRVNTAAGLQVQVASTVVATSAPGLILPDHWYYVEMRVTLGDAPDGAAIVRLNNVEVINVTGVDTRGGGTKTVFDTLMLHGGFVAGTDTIDDLYIKTGDEQSFAGSHRLFPADPPTFVVEVNTGVWEDVTCDIRTITIDRGRSAYTDAFSAGTATVALANFEGDYSAWNPDGIWATAGRSFTTDVPIRIGAKWPNLVEFFTGSTDGVVDSWPGTTDALASVTATDGFKKLARHNGGPRDAVGAGELTGARVNRLLDDAGWTDPRKIDAGQCHMQVTAMDGVTLDLLREVGESEWGWLFVDHDGALVFRQRDAFQSDARMTSVQWIFTDLQFYADTPHFAEPQGAVCYTDLQLAADDSRIINVAQITPPGIATQTATDATSVAWFDPRTYTSQLPISTGPDALGTAQVIVLEYAADDKRIEAISFNGLHSKTNMDAAVNLRINDRIRVGRLFPGSTFAVDIELLVMGIHHDIVAKGADKHAGTWTVTLQTASAVFTAAFGHWDDPVGPAGAETAGWDVSQWAI